VIHRDELKYTDDVIATLQSGNPLWYIANALNIDVKDVQYHYGEVFDLNHNGKVLPLRYAPEPPNVQTRTGGPKRQYRRSQIYPRDPQYYAERTAGESWCASRWLRLGSCASSWSVPFVYHVGHLCRRRYVRILSHNYTRVKWSSCRLFVFLAFDVVLPHMLRNGAVFDVECVGDLLARSLCEPRRVLWPIDGGAVWLHRQAIDAAMSAHRFAVGLEY